MSQEEAGRGAATENEREQQQRRAVSQQKMEESSSTERLSKQLEDEEEDDDEEGVQVARPITAPHVGEGNLRVWDPQGGTGGRGGAGGFRRTLPRRAGSSHQVGLGEEVMTYVYVIRCGESSIAHDVVRGRCPSAVLTALGQRQVRALAMSLLSRGLRFDALFSSPTPRCKQTALSVCQEINFNQDRLEFGESLMEMSNGFWEGLRKFDVYSVDTVDLMVNLNQDFHAPGGESQRQVEFRMVEYLNNVVLSRPLEVNRRNDQRLYFAQHDIKTPSIFQVTAPNSYSNNDALITGQGRTRTQVLSPPPQGIGSLVSDDQRLIQMPSTYTVALFSHEMAIKCLLRGLMAFPPSTIEQLCIDPTSITLLKHSTIYGWKIIQVNDIAHLRSV
ncbi:hypothetical protein L7F22_035387 [Adiantum nelumboides]|nr:hypothetical protein [Adiantum nelumboides]